MNGVRRALVPQTGAKQKVGAVEDDRQTRIPAQGLDSNALIKLITNGNKSLGTPQNDPPDQQMGQVHQGRGQEGTKGNGQPPRNGATFVLDPSKCKDISECVLFHFDTVWVGLFTVLRSKDTKTLVWKERNISLG